MIKPDTLEQPIFVKSVLNEYFLSLNEIMDFILRSSIPSMLYVITQYIEVLTM
jgi:hypothetical protein